MKTGRKATKHPSWYITKADARALNTRMADLRRKRGMTQARTGQMQFGVTRMGAKMAKKRRGPHKPWHTKFLAAVERLGCAKEAAAAAGVPLTTVKVSLIRTRDTNSGFSHQFEVAMGHWLARQIALVASGHVRQLSIGKRQASALAKILNGQGIGRPATD